MSAISRSTVAETIDKLIARHGAEHEEQIRIGVAQVAERFRPVDGDDEAFQALCLEHYIANPAERRRAFERLQEVMEQIEGHLHEVRRELRRPLDLDLGPIHPVDRLLGGINLAAHVTEDLFRGKVAFVALLNFPVSTLASRLAHGAAWDRERWAVSRLTDRFATRLPAEVRQEVTRALSGSYQYVAGYNIHMGSLRTRDDRALFPEGLKLISHWGLRDELKSQYAEGEAGLERQRMIFDVMLRIVRQEIPAAVIDDGTHLWTPATNKLRARDGGEVAETLSAREPDTRYRHLLDNFRALRREDPYYPATPTYIERKFELERQMTEREVEELLVAVLESAEFGDLAALIKQRLGRELEPFDIWYAGFAPRAALSEDELDRIVGARFPDPAAFQEALPELLETLGFTPERARWLSERIVVDPSRGAGHAMGARRREDRAHLRTRFGADGMDYKGYNIAIHELGHNVEQVFSLNAIDHWFLRGVPNTAFTEAFAFVFQGRDLDLLGLTEDDATRGELFEPLRQLWQTAEIGAVGLVDMQVWRWLYENPSATPAELREAVLANARDVWNRFFAPHFGQEDVELLAIYSHMISNALYLPDYSLGHIIAFQIDRALRRGDFGADFERMARLGRLTPTAWMEAAVGEPLAATALLEAARTSLETVER